LARARADADGANDSDDDERSTDFGRSGVEKHGHNSGDHRVGRDEFSIAVALACIDNGGGRTSDLAG